MKNSCERIRTIFSVGLWKEYTCCHRLMLKRKGLKGQCLTLFLLIKKVFIWLVSWLIMNIFSDALFLISWRWESGKYSWENSLVVSAHTSVHVVGAAPGNGLTTCVPSVSHSHSLPLWETLQDKQSLLKLDLSLGFTPLFHLELKLGTEHWAYAG